MTAKPAPYDPIEVRRATTTIRDTWKTAPDTHRAFLAEDWPALARALAALDAAEARWAA